MGKIYTTNEICELCDISRKQLRYYEERGMLTGVLRNESNNYRYFTIEHVKQIIAAKELKNINISLDEIKKVFFTRNIDSVQLTIEKRIQSAKDDLERSLACYEQTMIMYVRLMEGISILKTHTGSKGHIIDQQYQVMDFPTRDIIALNYNATFEDEDRMAIEQAARIQVIAKELHTAALGSMIYMTFGHFDPDCCTFDNKPHPMKAAMQILDTKIPSPYYERIESFRGVSALHIGDFPNALAPTYVGLLKWAKDMGFHLANYSVEDWLIGSTITDNQNYWLMRIIIPFADQQTCP